MINVLIIENDISIVKEIELYLKDNNKIRIYDSTIDIIRGLNIIKNNYKEIDVILLDIINVNMDGFKLLEEIKDLDINHKIIVYTSFNSIVTINRLSNLGIFYFMLKPINLDVLESRIVDCYINKYRIRLMNKSLNFKIYTILHDLGLSEKYKGYNYLVDAIYILLNKDYYMNKVYRIIARKNNTIASNIEKDIRIMKESCFELGNNEVKNLIYGYTYKAGEFPTTNTFITTIVGFLNTIKSNDITKKM